MSNVIYRILTDQEQIFKGYLELRYDQVDLANKKASFDALSKVELVTLKLQNRHKIYRRETCVYCGNGLNINENKTGKSKNSCDFSCNRKYLQFLNRVYGKQAPRNINNTKIKIFREYCLIKLLFRYPAVHLNDQLKRVCRNKELRIQPIKIENT